MVDSCRHVYTVKKSSLIIMFTVFPFFEPGGLSEVYIINRILFVWRGISILLGTLLIATNFFKDKEKLKIKDGIITKIMLLLFFSVIIYSAVKNSSLTINSIWQYINIVFISFYYAFQLNYKRGIIVYVTSNIMIVINLINLLTVIGNVSFSDEEVMYFFGIRTTFTLYVVFMIMITMYDSYLQKKKLFAIKTWFAILLGLAQILIQWVATGIVCIVLFLLCVYYFLIIKTSMHKHFAFILTCIGITLNYLIVYFNIQNYFSFLIENILHKTLSLHDRTYIWEVVLAKIARSPVWGYGTMYERVKWYSRILLAHNLWLQIMLAGGIVLTVSFIVLLLLIAKNIDRIDDLKIKSICIASIGVILALSITEVVYTTYMFWIILTILSEAYLIKKI